MHMKSSPSEVGTVHCPGVPGFLVVMETVVMENGDGLCQDMNWFVKRVPCPTRILPSIQLIQNLL